MMKTLFLRSWFVLLSLVLVSSVTVSAEAEQRKGTLWQISKEGEQVGYLLGTIHIGDPRVTNFSAPLLDAFESSKSVTLEAVLDQQYTLAVQQAMRRSPVQTPLNDLITAAEFKKLLEALESRGLPSAVVTQMQPWAAMMILGLPAGDVGIAMDMLLYQKALREGKQVYGLETAEEHISIFTSVPEEKQIAMLKETVDNLEIMDAMQEKMIETYLEGDLAELEALNQELMSQTENQDIIELTNKLLNERNYRMYDRMQPRLQQGDAFIAVGALHLAGEEGLLALLAQGGYTLKPVDQNR